MTRLSHKNNKPLRKHVLGGLNPTPVDDRDFPLGGIQDYRFEDVPNTDWLVGTFNIKDQEHILDDGCTGYALAAVSEDQEEVELDPGFAFMLGKKMQGNWKSWGGDLRSALKGQCEYGAIEVGENPLDFGGKPRDFIANWNNWPLEELKPKALKHKKQSYFKIEKLPGHDMFDSIRAALWHNRDLKRSSYTGVIWRPGWLYSKVIPKAVGTGGVGHAIKLCNGQKFIDGVPYLILQQSYGEDAGENGFHYVSREVINRDFNYGFYMVIDMPKEEAKEILRGKGLLVETLETKKITSPFENFTKFLKKLFKK